MAVNKKPLKSGGYSWIVRVQDATGKWYPAKTFEKKVDAEAYEAKLRRLKSIGTKATSGGCTLKEYWNKWTTERRTEVSLSWKEHQSYFFRDHIDPYLGSKELKDISSSDISTLLGALREKGLSNSSRLHIYNLLNLMLRDAVDFYKDLLHVNPVRKDHRPKIGEIQRGFLKPEESRKFLQSVINHRFGVAYWIMLGCGLRIGEVQGLKHGDLDFESGYIHLKRQWNEREQRLTPLKNDKETIVQMPSALVTFLKSKFPNAMDPDMFVVTSSVGTMADGKKIRGNLKAACKAAGIKKVSPHELRHSCTELWIEMGASEEDLRRLLNHKSSASTRKYIHRTTERLSRLATQVNMDEDLSAKVTPLRVKEKAPLSP